MSRLKRRIGLRRTTRLSRSAKPLKRTTPLASSARSALPAVPGKTSPAAAPRTLTTRRAPKFRDDAEREMAARWKRQVVAVGRCESCGDVEGPFDAHHVVPQRLLRPLERRRGLRPGALLWDPRIGLCLCSEPAPNRCHQRHELAVARVPRARLRPETIALAEDLEHGWFIDRHYPSEVTTA